MKQFIIVLCICISQVVLGHNPLSSRYHLKADASVSMLTIHLSQDGVNQLFVNTYGKEYFENLDTTEFKELIVNYVKDNFNLIIDGEAIKLENGGIRLGEHQTDLKFVLNPISENAEKISINIPSFKENGEHQTIFSYEVNGKNDKVILSKRNDFSEDVFLTETHQKASLLSTNLLIAILMLVALGVAGKIVYTKRQEL